MPYYQTDQWLNSQSYQYASFINFVWYGAGIHITMMDYVDSSVSVHTLKFHGLICLTDFKQTFQTLPGMSAGSSLMVQV